MGFFKRHKFLTALLVILLAVAVIGGAVMWYVWDKLNRIDYSDGKLPQQSTGTQTPTDPAEEPEEETPILMETDVADLPEMEIVLSTKDISEDRDVFNILLLGTDERVGEFSVDARADSIMLLSVNREENCLKLVSLQRGMGVPILEGDYAGEYDWLTHCFRYGGADLMLKEVQHCLRVEVDCYVRINFNHFKQVIDAVGGVDISLTPVEAEYLGLPAGTNRLDGEKALAYSRLRAIDSDWGRIQRQRNVIQSIVYSAKNLSLLELDEAANTILPMIQTNLTKAQILDLVLFAPKVLGTEIEQMSLPAEGTYGGMTGLGGRSLYAVDFEANAAILEKFLYGED